MSHVDWIGIKLEASAVMEWRHGLNHVTAHRIIN
jgi:hypothetical protein